MDREDLFYLCTTIANLSGIPLRLYEKDEQIFYHALVDLPKDPMDIYRQAIWDITSHVGYFATPFFDYYGIVNASPYRLIVGPTRQVEITDSELKAMAFQADISSGDSDAFVTAMKNIVRMPLESVLQMLCTVNFVLNRERLALRDVVMKESDETELRDGAMSESDGTRLRDIATVASDEMGLHDEAMAASDGTGLRDGAMAASDETGLRDGAMPKSDKRLLRGQHRDGNTDSRQPATGIPRQDYTGYAVEQRLMDMVSSGDLAALKNWLSSAPAIRAGILSSEYIRQQKNIFIVTATLASRAAIRGGLDTKTAFFLSDAYIQRCELLKTPEQIVKLQYHMITDYTERVGQIRIGQKATQLSMRIANYVQSHLSDVITVDALAKETLLCRSRLTARFKEETGQTLTEFVMRIKIEEAKRLIRYTDKSLSAISDYLGFSSQSHFSRIFKKYTDIAPGEYRERNTTLIKL